MKHICKKVLPYVIIFLAELSVVAIVAVIYLITGYTNLLWVTSALGVLFLAWLIQQFKRKNKKQLPQPSQYQRRNRLQLLQLQEEQYYFQQYHQILRNRQQQQQQQQQQLHENDSLSSDNSNLPSYDEVINSENVQSCILLSNLHVEKPPPSYNDAILYI